VVGATVGDAKLESEGKADKVEGKVAAFLAILDLMSGRRECSILLRRPARHGVIAPVSIPMQVISCIPTHHSTEPFWNGRALAPPQPPTGIVDYADGGHLLRNIQANKMGHRLTSNIANHGRRLPDRDTIGGSRANRDYRMFRHYKAVLASPGFHILQG
jgi:hypothetical protein